MPIIIAPELVEYTDRNWAVCTWHLVFNASSLPGQGGLVMPEGVSFDAENPTLCVLPVTELGKLGSI